MRINDVMRGKNEQGVWGVVGSGCLNEDLKCFFCGQVANMVHFVHFFVGE